VALTLEDERRQIVPETASIDFPTHSGCQEIRSGGFGSARGRVRSRHGSWLARCPGGVRQRPAPRLPERALRAILITVLLLSAWKLIE
jgi:hypothetical protein